jgi:hypothetical protein
VNRLFLILIALAPVPAFFVMRERDRRKAAHAAYRVTGQQARDAIDRQLAAERSTQRLAAELQAERIIHAVTENALRMAENHLTRDSAWRERSLRGERTN